MFESLQDVTFVDVFDILIVALFLYLIYLWFKKTKSVFVLVGIIISGAVYLAANIFGLRLLVALMQGFFAVILLAIVIIFQEEIRRLFEQIALFSLSPKLKKTANHSCFQDQIDVLTETVFSLADKHTGAIIVLKGRDTLIRNTQRGVDLGGKLSAPLLKSIFDDHSEGHDGAVIIEDGRVLQFACHLPLSKDIEQLQDKGTRHAAALGLSEVTDALSIVVSETTGDISLCQTGILDVVKDRETFKERLEKFLNSAGGQEKFFKKNFLVADLKQKLAVVFLSVFLWWFFVHESVVVYKSYEVPVKYFTISGNLKIGDIDPAEVKVVLSGMRRNFYFLDKRDIKVLVKILELDDLTRIDDGYHELTLTASNVVLPGSYTIVNIFPRNIKVRLDQNQVKVGGVF